MSVRTEVADAVASQINAATWSNFTIEAVRAGNKQSKTLEELSNAVIVEVIPRPLEIMIGAQGHINKTPVVDVFMRKKMKPSQQNINDGSIPIDELDLLETLAEDIAESFTPLTGTRDGRLDDYADAAFKAVRFMSGEVNDQFTKTRIWQAQIRLTFTI